MKLWLIYPQEEYETELDYDDCAQQFVIRAETAEQAREIAQKNGGDEVRYTKFSWLNKEHAHCHELSVEGDAMLIMRDFLAG